MIYLFATIALNTFVFSLFKLFPRFQINHLQAIVFNYVVCVLTGCLFLGYFPFTSEILSRPSLPWAVLTGCMFIAIFNLIAWRTREDGMTTTTIANKLSLVIPALFSVFLYHESMTLLKAAGIVLALPAVYFTTKGADGKNKPVSLFFPALLFIGSGLLDTLVKYAEASFLHDVPQQAAHTIYIFASASLIGILILTIMILMKKAQLRWRNVGAGLLLGVPNYFSIFFLIRYLNSDVFQSSAAIPVNNIGIVFLSSLTALLLFRERFTWQRGLGLFLAAVSILLLALSDKIV